jgi:hypothetical protein
VGAIGEEVAQLRKGVVKSGDEERRPVAVLRVGGMHFACEQ